MTTPPSAVRPTPAATSHRIEPAAGKVTASPSARAAGRPAAGASAVGVLPLAGAVSGGAGSRVGVGEWEA